MDSFENLQCIPGKIRNIYFAIFIPGNACKWPTGRTWYLFQKASGKHCRRSLERDFKGIWHEFLEKNPVLIARGIQKGFLVKFRTCCRKKSGLNFWKFPAWIPRKMKYIPEGFRITFLKQSGMDFWSTSEWIIGNIWND